MSLQKSIIPLKNAQMAAAAALGSRINPMKIIHTAKKAIIRALAIILLYLIIGTAVFAAWMEDWDAIDAVYFTVATFTTVGYGDLFPVTKGQRIFGIFFVTLGIMIIGGVVLGVLMDALFGIFENAIDESEKQAQEKFIGKFNDDEQSPPQDHPDDAHKKSKLKLMKRMKTIVKNLILAALIFVPGLIIGHFEGWLFYESIYYSIVTATTVGYGDLSPQNMWTRLAACFYLPLCVTVMASVFGQITSFYMDRRTKEAEDEFFHRKLTLKDLEEMDFGGDGNVNSEEFLIFMLVTLGKVDSASIDQIQALFRKLDVDGGGCLDMADICIRAFGDDEARSRISDDRNV
mmetsp:Transcript_19410/g.28695  ORF Transcript_19410/g.28695 Transcript_19410/m.28695 type:complete len:346 (-) Transcript_19410:299-1336(-)